MPDGLDVLTPFADDVAHKLLIESYDPLGGLCLALLVLMV